MQDAPPERNTADLRAESLEASRQDSETRAGAEIHPTTSAMEPRAQRAQAESEMRTREQSMQGASPERNTADVRAESLEPSRQDSETHAGAEIHSTTSAVEPPIQYMRDVVQERATTKSSDEPPEASSHQHPDANASAEIHPTTSAMEPPTRRAQAASELHPDVRPTQDALPEQSPTDLEDASSATLSPGRSETRAGAEIDPIISAKEPPIQPAQSGSEMRSRGQPTKDAPAKPNTTDLRDAPSAASSPQRADAKTGAQIHPTASTMEPSAQYTQPARDALPERNPTQSGDASAAALLSERFSEAGIETRPTTSAIAAHIQRAPAASELHVNARSAQDTFTEPSPKDLRSQSFEALREDSEAHAGDEAYSITSAMEPPTQRAQAAGELHSDVQPAQDAFPRQSSKDLRAESSAASSQRDSGAKTGAPIHPTTSAMEQPIQRVQSANAIRSREQSMQDAPAKPNTADLRDASSEALPRRLESKVDDKTPSIAPIQHVQAASDVHPQVQPTHVASRKPRRLESKADSKLPSIVPIGQVEAASGLKPEVQGEFPAALPALELDTKADVEIRRIGRHDESTVGVRRASADSVNSKSAASHGKSAGFEPRTEPDHLAIVPLSAERSLPATPPPATRPHDRPRGDVRVHIDRIEIVGANDVPPPRVARPKPSMTLDRYAERRK